MRPSRPTREALQGTALEKLLKADLPADCTLSAPRPVHKNFFLPEQIHQIQQAALSGKTTFTTSTDIGRSQVELKIVAGDLTVLCPFDEKFSLEKLPKLKPRTYYHIEDGQLRPFHFFCEQTKKVYKLLPTRDIPSFSISSAPMHQITRSTPAKDTAAKIKALQPLSADAIALDTCFGLGYSSGALLKHIRQVVSCEWDRNSLEVASLNPHSHDILASEKLNLFQGDVFSLIKSFRDESFDIVLHDPPTPKISPLLYSSDFYGEVFRILKSSGKIYHYTPRPNIQKKQRDFPAEVKKRLAKAGFRNLQMSEPAQGLYGFK